MSRSTMLLLFLAACIGSADVDPLAAQLPEPYRHDPPPARDGRLTALGPARAGSSAPVFSQSEQKVLEYYRGDKAAQTLREMPFRPSVTSPRRPLVGGSSAARRPRGAKPFTAVRPDPTVSPYMNLFLEEDRFAAPNYFAFVRPQLQQLNTNRLQQQEFQQLRRGLRGVELTSGSQPLSPGGQAIHQARFQNTGHFYPAAR